MNKKITAILIIILILGYSVSMTYRELNLRKEENAILRSDYLLFMDIKQKLKNEKMFQMNEDVVNKVAKMIDTLTFKNKISRLKPQNEDLEIILKNLSQDELLRFLDSLDQLQGIGISQLDLSKDTANTMVLSLNIVRASSRASQGRPEGRHFQDFNSPLAGSEACTSDPARG